MTGPEEVIIPLPAPWLGLRGDFLFGEASPGATAVLFDGWLSSPSSFLCETLLTDLGTDEVPSSVPFASSPPLSYGLPPPLSFALQHPFLQR